jgi:hypothetical protein
LFDAAEFAARGVCRFPGIHAALNIFLGEKVQVSLQLRMKVLVEPLLAEYIPQSCEPIQQTQHSRPSSHS